MFYFVSTMKLDRYKLIQRRAKKDWRQIDAASKCGVSIKAIGKAEGGEEIDDLTAGKIANGYGLDLAELEVRETRSA